MTKHARSHRVRNARWLALYTGLFLCGMLALCLLMAVRHRLLIWRPDGLEQHYTVIGYLGNLVRELLAGKGLPLVNFHLGQGMDVLTTCTYYGYTDPLNLLAALAGAETYGIAYVAIAVLRCYLAGLAFALYARKVGARDAWGIGCSAAIYVFSGYFLILLGRHPYFLNGGLYLPLLLLGVERVLDGRRWGLYTLVAALTLVVNFYFAYMNTIVAILYIVVRLLARIHTRGVRRSAGDGLVLLGGYLLGAALSAFVFLPVALVYLQNGRLGVAAGYAGSPWHYSLSYYREMALLAFNGNILQAQSTAGFYTGLSFLPLAMFGLMELFVPGPRRGRGRRRQIRIALYLCVLVACVPLLGKVMNGMAYVSNRWIYALALFVALGCCFGLPRLFEDAAPRRTMVVIALLYAVAAAAAAIAMRKPRFLVGAALAAIPAALVFLWGSGFRPSLDGRRMKVLLTLALAVMIVGHVCTNYFTMKSHVEAQPNGSIADAIASQAKAQYIGDDGVYRVSQGAYNDPHSMLLDYMGTSYYWSLVDRQFAEYYKGLWLPSLKMSYDFYGFFGNAAMSAVASVKYFVRGEGDRFVIPYGFRLSDRALDLPDGTAAEVYENEYALPLGYAYDCRLSREAYEALPVEDRLQALTRCAIVETAVEGLRELDGGDLAELSQEIPFEVAGSEGVELAEGSIRADAGGRLRLTFDAPEDAAIYLMAGGLCPDGEVRDVEYGRITVETAAGISQDVMPTPACNFFYPKEGSAYCLGTGPLDACELVFENAMSYHCDGLRIVAIPLDGYREDMRARAEESLTDVRLSNNRIAGRIRVSGDRILQIAVPYSKGWRAWVDGVEQPVFRCGGMYMGMQLEAGEHDIEMRYITPGLIPGAAVSCAALLLFAALWIAGCRRRRRGPIDGDRESAI